MKRQLAAILYADVAGYSRLTRVDEAETHRKLDDGLNLLTETISVHDGSKIHEAGDAILGEFPASDAYFVRCGLGDTMTQTDIDAGQVIVIVGFAPLKPAEFVIIRVQQKVNQQ